MIGMLLSIAFLTGVSLALMPMASAALRRFRRLGEPDRIEPRYNAPTSLPPLVAAHLVERARAPLAAQLLHVAIAGAVAITERNPSGRPGARRQPRLRLLDRRAGLDPLDAETISLLFPTAEPGATSTLALRKKRLKRGIPQLHRDALAAAQERGLLTFERSAVVSTMRIAAATTAALAFVGAVMLSIGSPLAPPLPGELRFPAGMAAFLVFLVTAYAVVEVVVERSPVTRLTPLGMQERDRLYGVREYLRLSNARRIRILRSVPRADGRADPADILRMHEHLMPYAVLFGLEHEWAVVLARGYSSSSASAGGDEAPFWYEPAAGWSPPAFPDEPRALERAGDSFSEMISGFSSALSGCPFSDGSETPVSADLTVPAHAARRRASAR